MMYNSEVLRDLVKWITMNYYETLNLNAEINFLMSNSSSDNIDLDNTISTFDSFFSLGFRLLTSL